MAAASPATRRLSGSSRPRLAHGGHARPLRYASSACRTTWGGVDVCAVRVCACCAHVRVYARLLKGGWGVHYCVRVGGGARNEWSEVSTYYVRLIDFHIGVIAIKHHISFNAIR